jgi:restriction endonuclease S subunit
LVKPERLLFSKINARKGCIFYSPKTSKEFVVSNEYPVLKLDDNQVSGEYLNLALRIGPANKALLGSAAGMAKARTYLSDIQSIKIPIPPLPIQRKIVDYWQEENKKAALAEQKVKIVSEDYAFQFIDALGLSMEFSI